MRVSPVLLPGLSVFVYPGVRSRFSHPSLNRRRMGKSRSDPVPLCERDDFGLHRSGDLRIPFSDEHVDLRPNAEFCRVNPWLDREAGAWNQPALIVRFVVVHVYAVSVHLLPQAVAGSMDELRTVPGALDHLARCAVDLVSAQLAPRSGGAFHELDAGVTAIPGGGKHLRVFLRHDSTG